MFEIDLEWPVASGYELRTATELEGEIALYRVEGATITWRRPLEVTPTIHTEFANLDGSEQSCLGFAHKYGLLNMAGYPPNNLFGNEPFEWLRDWKGYIQRLKGIMAFCEFGRDNPRQAWKQFNNREFEPITQFEPVLSMQGPRAPPSLSWRCTSLIGAIELQAIQSILGGHTSLQCAECSTWFEIGPKARRSLAKFCSRLCKDRFHNRQKRKMKR
jgi:hypothetical protein